jgi:hypothetical protein
MPSATKTLKIFVTGATGMEASYVHMNVGENDLTSQQAISVAMRSKQLRIPIPNKLRTSLPSFATPSEELP